MKNRPQKTRSRRMLIAMVSSFAFTCSTQLISCAPTNGSKVDPKGGKDAAASESLIFSNQHTYVAKMTLVSSTAASAGSDAEDDLQSADLPVPTPTPTPAATPTTTPTPTSTATPSATPESKKPKGPVIGTNTYKISLAHADFSALQDPTLAITFEHSSAKIVRPFPATVTTNPDGSFQTSIELKGKGTWRIRLQISEKGSSDEADLQVVLQ